MKVFECRKDGLFKSLLIGTIFLCTSMLVLPFVMPKGNALNLIVIPSTGISILTAIWLLWVLLSTQYGIDDEHLSYQFGPTKGKIKINEIKEVIVGETQWTGFKKFGLAQNGLIVKYRFSDLYISPITNDTFVQELLKVNPKIKVIQK